MHRKLVLWHCFMNILQWGWFKTYSKHSSRKLSFTLSFSHLHACASHDIACVCVLHEMLGLEHLDIIVLKGISLQWKMILIIITSEWFNKVLLVSCCHCIYDKDKIEIALCCKRPIMCLVKIMRFHLDEDRIIILSSTKS